MIARTLAAALIAAVVPALVWAAPSAQIVAATRIVAAVDKVAYGLVTDPDEVVTPAYTPGDQSVPLGMVTIVPGTPQITSTFIAIPIAIAVDGKVERTVLAGYRLQQYVHTAVAARDLDPGTVLGDDDVTLARVPFVGRQPVDPSSLVGRKLRTLVPKGSPVFVEQTSAVDLVKAGSMVVLIVRDGPVALTADVLARQSGGLGDVVAVYNPETHKSLSGTVTGPDRVELNLPGAED